MARLPEMRKTIVIVREFLNRYRVLGLAVMLLALPEYLSAQECSPHSEVVDGMPIVEISIDNENIFDLEQEEQNLWIHRWGNKLHVKTRKKNHRRSTPVWRSG